MRQVAQGLDHPLVFLPPQLVEHQGQDDGCGEAEQEFQSGNNNGILEYIQEVIAVEKPVEVVQADPRASRDALEQLEFLESQRDAVQGAVLEQQVPEDHRDDHHKMKLMLFYPPQEGTPFFEPVCLN